MVMTDDVHSTKHLQPLNSGIARNYPAVFPSANRVRHFQIDEMWSVKRAIANR